MCGLEVYPARCSRGLTIIVAPTNTIGNPLTTRFLIFRCCRIPSSGWQTVRYDLAPVSDRGIVRSELARPGNWSFEASLCCWLLCANLGRLVIHRRQGIAKYESGNNEKAIRIFEDVLVNIFNTNSSFNSMCLCTVHFTCNWMTILSDLMREASNYTKKMLF